MILSYQFKNFLSFKDNVEFSLCAPKNKVKKRFPDNYITSKNGNDILKTAVIVGENAGGKSNFVRSLEYFKSFFTGSGDVMTYRPTINTNNIKTSCPLEWNTEQSFEIELLIDGQLYKYYLELDASGIVSEILKLKNNDKQKYKEVLNAKRVELNVKCNGEPGNCLTEKCERISKVSYALTINNFDNKMKKNLKESAENKKQNGLFITKLSILGYEPAVQFTEWMKKAVAGEQCTKL